MSTGGFSAERIAAAFAGDEQLNAPERPRLVDGLVRLAVPEGLMFEGAPERQLLRGRAARDFLPALLRELDGSRSVEELADALGERGPDRVRKAVALLYACGLLEDGDQPVPGPADTARWLSRTLDATRVNRS